MLITKLEDNIEKIESYNLYLENMKEISPEYDWEKRKIQSIYDELHSYNEWFKDLENNSLSIRLIKDDCLSVSGVYVSALNWEHMVKMMSRYKIISDYNSLYNYGVCDNATQVLNYFNKHLNENHFSRDKVYIIVLTPIFKRSQPYDGGWRWHKWGEYIGIQKSEYEYIYDEKDIDMVYVFRIKEIISE